MIKFVEITQKALEYDSKSETCSSFSTLREIYINPDYIVSMRENVQLKKEASSKSLVEGLDEGISFTELVVHQPGRISSVINVIGEPNSHMARYARKKK